MFCSKCGAELPPEAAFCGKCGQRISVPIPAGGTEAEPAAALKTAAPADAPEAAPAPQTEAPAGAEQQVAPAAPPVPPQPENGGAQPAKPRRRGRAGKMILIVLIAVVVLAAAVFLLYRFGVFETLGLSAGKTEALDRTAEDAEAEQELVLNVEDVDLSRLPLVTVTVSCSEEPEDPEELDITILENGVEMETETRTVRGDTMELTYTSPLKFEAAARTIEVKVTGAVNQDLTFEIAGEEGTPAEVRLFRLDGTEAPLMRAYYCISGKDDAGEVPQTLTEKNFALAEGTGGEAPEDCEITGVRFVPGIRFCVVADKSGSVDALAMAAQAEGLAELMACVDRLPGSSAMLFAYDTTVMPLTAFSDGTDAVPAALEKYSGYGSSAFYDALMAAIETAAAQDGRGVVVGITDGPDTVSTYKAREVGEYAAACGVSVVIAGVGSGVEAADLQQICDLSVWGVFTRVDSFRDLGAAFDEIFDENGEYGGYAGLYEIEYRSESSAAGTRELQLQLMGGGYAGSAAEEVQAAVQPGPAGIATYHPAELLAELDMNVVEELIAANAKEGTRFSFFVKELGSGLEFGTAGSREGMSASALINVPILFALSEQIRNGEASLNDTTEFHYTYAGRGNLTQNMDGQRMTVSELVESMLTYSDNNATNSLIEYLGMDTINEICRSYDFLSVDIQRLLVSGSPRDPDNFVSAGDLVGMVEMLCSDWSGLGAYYLYDHFMIEDDNKTMGVGKYLTGSAVFLNHNALTPEKYNEVALIIDGTQIYIIAIMSDYGAYAGSAAAAAEIAAYVHDCIVG